jgi:hypothetical protein
MLPRAFAWYQAVSSVRTWKDVVVADSNMECHNFRWKACVKRRKGCQSASWSGFKPGISRMYCSRQLVQWHRAVWYIPCCTAGLNPQRSSTAWTGSEPCLETFENINFGLFIVECYDERWTLKWNGRAGTNWSRTEPEASRILSRKTARSIATFHIHIIINYAWATIWMYTSCLLWN